MNHADISESSYPSLRRSVIVVAILVLTAILAYTDRQVLSLLVDPMRRDLGISDTQVSLLLGTAFALVYGTAGIPLGWLADRLSRRNLIFAGVLIWSLATLACGLAQNYQQLFIARILVGLGEAVLSPAAISLISDYFPPHRRGAAVGTYLAGIAIGIGSALVIGGGVLHAIDGGLLAGTPVADLAPWRLVLLAIGAPGLLWSLVILVIREPLRRSETSAEGAEGESGAAPRSGWFRLCAVYGIVATASLVDNAVGAWAPSLLIREFGQNPDQVGIRLGLLLVGGYAVGFMAGGILADRASSAGGRFDKARICLIAALVILPIGLLLDSANVTLVLTGIPLLFGLSGIVTGCGFSAILDMVPNRSRGLAMAISFFLNVALGAGFGPVLVSLASGHLFGATAGLGPALSFVVILFYLGGGLFLALALRSHRHHRMA